MPNLDQRLAAERDALLAGIQPPDIDHLRVRAGARRRRRRVAMGGTALACALAVGVSVAVAVRPSGSPPPPAASPTTTTATEQPMWSGGGLVLRGLPNNRFTDLPGSLHDVEFVDGRTGYALLADCRGGGRECTIGLATTADSGLSWQTRSLPEALAPGSPVPSLVPVGGGLILTTATPWFSPDGGVSWSAVPTAEPMPTAAALPDGARLTLGGQSGTSCAARRLDAWLPDGGRATLSRQPDLAVCWAAATPTADGAWWVGGRTGTGQPAAAVSRDGGASWTVQPFAGPAGSWVKISTLGGYAYAAVVTGDPAEEGRLTVASIYRSTDGGRAFAAFGDSPPSLPGFVGDLVPALDGRLVAAGPNWVVSDAGAHNFHELLDAGMPPVARLARTGGGWVAYDLFTGGWAAYSQDGTTWHKITIK